MKEFVKCKLLFTIFSLTLAISFAIPNKVYALSRFGSIANMVIGQTSLTDCPAVENGGSYLTGFSQPYNAYFLDGKLLAGSPNIEHVKIYNTFPTQNNAVPDLIIGTASPCASVQSIYPPFNAKMAIRSSDMFYDGTHFFEVNYNYHRVLIYNHGIPTSSDTPADIVLGQPDFASTTANNGGLSAKSLNSPYSVWSDGTHLLISDGGNNRILIYNSIPTTNFASADLVIGQTDLTSNSGGTSATKFKVPRGIVYDGTRLYIADRDNNRILIYNNGIPTSNGAAADLVIGQPDLTTGTVNTGGIGPKTLNSPLAIKLRSGKLFVADRSNNRVLIYNTLPTANYPSADVVVCQPDFVSSAPNNGGLSGSSCDNPYSADSDGTHFAVADYNNNRILLFNAIPANNGTTADLVLGQQNMTSKGALGSTVINDFYFNSPESMSFDGTRLYVTDTMNSRILIYNSVPQTIGAHADVVIGQSTMTTGGSGVSATQLYNPYNAIADVINNKFFVTDRANHRVLVYNSIPTTNGASADFVIGQPNMTTGTANANGLSAKSLYYPGSITVIPSQQKMLIADGSNNRVLVFNGYPTSNNPSANIVIGQPDMVSNAANNGGVSAGTLSTPRQAYFDGTKLYISDAGNRRVLIYNSVPTQNGASADVVIGQSDFITNTVQTSGPYTYFNPTDVRVDNGRLLIADGQGHRVLIFNTIPTTNGALPDVVIGQNAIDERIGGSTQSKFVRPSSPMVIGNKLLVLDKFNNRIQYFDLGTRRESVTTNSLVNSTDVPLNFSATDAKDMMISEDNNFAGASWESYSASKTFHLSLADGNKTIYAKFRDFANYEGVTVTATLTLDTEKPTGTLLINHGAQLTKTAAVSLTISATDTQSEITQMIISNDAMFTDSNWEDYSTSKDFTLTSTNGSKTVYVKFKDKAGNESLPNSATIVLDSVAPQAVVITDLGLINSIPDKTPLFYYFTSQTPRIKGKSEANSTIHFYCNGNDYITSADNAGYFEITLPELPHTFVEINYFAEDLANNKGVERLLKLVIGIENFPVKESVVISTPLPSVTVNPTPSNITIPELYSMTVTSSKGGLLKNIKVYVEGQQYVSDKDGKIYLEAKPNSNTKFKVEMNGVSTEASVLGDRIIVESSPSQKENSENKYTSILLIMFALCIGGVFYYLFIKHSTR